MMFRSHPWLSTWLLAGGVVFLLAVAFALLPNSLADGPLGMIGTAFLFPGLAVLMAIRCGPHANSCGTFVVYAVWIVVPTLVWPSILLALRRTPKTPGP